MFRHHPARQKCPKLSPCNKRQRRRDNHLCLYCGGSRHLLSTCPLKGQRPSVSEGILTGVTNHSSPSASHPALSAQLQVQVLLDSGSDASFICPTLVKCLGISTVPLTKTHAPLTGVPLEEVQQATNRSRFASRGTTRRRWSSWSCDRHACLWCWANLGCVSTTPRWTGARVLSQGGVPSATRPASSLQPVLHLQPYPRLPLLPICHLYPLSIMT